MVLRFAVLVDHRWRHQLIQRLEERITHVVRSTLAKSLVMNSPVEKNTLVKNILVNNLVVMNRQGKMKESRESC